MADPLWGRMVTVTAVLARDRDTPGKRTWVRSALSEPTEALVTGWRTLADGTVEGGRRDYWSGEVEPREFYPERHFRAYVVVLSDRTGPMYALPDDVAPSAPSVPTPRYPGAHLHLSGTWTVGTVRVLLTQAGAPPEDVDAFEAEAKAIGAIHAAARWVTVT